MRKLYEGYESLFAADPVLHVVDGEQPRDNVPATALDMAS